MLHTPRCIVLSLLFFSCNILNVNLTVGALGIRFRCKTGTLVYSSQPKNDPDIMHSYSACKIRCILVVEKQKGMCKTNMKETDGTGDNGYKII